MPKTKKTPPAVAPPVVTDDSVVVTASTSTRGVPSEYNDVRLEDIERDYDPW
jgi:hypothetical protein